MLDKLVQLRARKSVQLWRQRAIKTTKCNRLIYNYAQANRIRIFTKCYQVLKQNWSLKRLIAKRLINAERAINLELKREAFRGFNQEKKLNEVQCLWGYARAEIVIKNMIERHKQQRFYVAFQKFKNNAKIIGLKMRFLKKVVNNRWAHRRRKYFLRWKKEGERLTLANFINDFGETRKEWF